MGYKLEDLAKSPLVEDIHPDDAGKIKTLFGILMAHPGTSVSAEWRHKHKNGNWRWMEGTATNLLNHPSVKAIVNNYRDITQRKETETQLADAVAQLTHIFNNVYEGLFAKDTRNGRYIYISAGCERIYGYKLKEFYDNPKLWYDAIHPDDRDIMEKANVNLKAGRSAEMQYRIVHRDSSVRWIETRIIPELDADGQLIRVDGIVMDITARKEAEKNLEMLNHSLEMQVADRTQQLHEANKALESFSYSVAHDLQTPLRILSGYVRILEDDYNDVFDAPGKELLNVITSNARLMGRLITDLLNFSRISLAVIRKDSVNFDDMVPDVIASIKQAEDTVSPEFRIHPLGYCVGDGNLLRQVWVNLIGNAVKYLR